LRKVVSPQVVARKLLNGPDKTGGHQQIIATIDRRCAARWLVRVSIRPVR